MWCAVWVIRPLFEQSGAVIVVVDCFVGCIGLVVCSLFVWNLFVVGLVCVCMLCESLRWGWALGIGIGVLFVWSCDCSLGCVGGCCVVVCVPRSIVFVVLVALSDAELCVLCPSMVCASVWCCDVWCDVCAVLAFVLVGRLFVCSWVVRGCHEY